jgi:hypothetical protein
MKMVLRWLKTISSNVYSLVYLHACVCLSCPVPCGTRRSAPEPVEALQKSCSDFQSWRSSAFHLMTDGYRHSPFASSSPPLNRRGGIATNGTPALWESNGPQTPSSLLQGRLLAPVHSSHLIEALSERNLLPSRSWTMGSVCRRAIFR